MPIESWMKLGMGGQGGGRMGRNVDDMMQEIWVVMMFWVAISPLN
jgi:hypothetical protein